MFKANHSRKLNGKNTFKGDNIQNILKKKKKPWRRKWQPTPWDSMENPMDRGAWQATVHGVTRVRHDLASKPLPRPVLLNMDRSDH